MAWQNYKAVLLTLGLGVAGIFAFSQMVIAKTPDLYFYPAKAWTVTAKPMQVATANVQNCSIQNEFNNGFVIQLEGSHRWVKALSIDFRQKAFENGKTYNVSLSVPGKVNKTFSVIASQENKLVIDLQEQKDFYQIMRDSAVLDLSIDVNNFRFYMTGFSSASAIFERCMAGGVIQPLSAVATQNEPIHASMNEESFNGAVMNESIAFEQNERSNAVIEIIPEDRQPVVQLIPVKEVRKIGGKIIDEKAPITLLIDNSTQVASPLVDKPHERMSEVLSKKIKENPDIVALEDDLRLNLQEQPKKNLIDKLEIPSNLYKESVTKKEPMIEKKLVTENNVKITKTLLPPFISLSQLENQNISSEVIVSKIQEVIPLVQEIKPVLDSVSISKFPKAKIKKKKSYDFTNLGSVESANDNMAFKSRPDPELVKKISQLESMVYKLKKENTELNSELKSVLSESEEERLSISSDNWNLERATMKYNEAERQIKRLGQQLQRERAQSSVEKEDLEAMLFDPQVTNEKQLAHLADLENKLLSVQDKLDSQRLRYEERIRILENHISQ